MNLNYQKVDLQLTGILTRLIVGFSISVVFIPESALISTSHSVPINKDVWDYDTLIPYSL